MWVVVLLCAAASSQCTLYDNLGAIDSYHWRLYSSKKDCDKNGQSVVDSWSTKDNTVYTYYCQDTSAPAGSPYSSMEIPPIAEQIQPPAATLPLAITAAPPQPASLLVGDTRTPPIRPSPPAKVVSQSLGVTFSALTPAIREQYRIAPELNGVVITDVAAGSQAAEKRVKPGDIIVSVSDVQIKKPEDVQDRLRLLVGDGTKTAFVLLKNPDGNPRFVIVGLSAPD
jgi:PDZ domain